MVVYLSPKTVLLYMKTIKAFRDLRIKDSLNAETPMHIASASKTFTGMAILQLVQQGKLGLEDTLGKFFPDSLPWCYNKNITESQERPPQLLCPLFREHEMGQENQRDQPGC